VFSDSRYGIRARNAASITAARAGEGTGAQATGEYCLVSGTINPVDPAAPQIKFQIAMRTVWNNKIMMFGGGETGEFGVRPS